MQHGKAPYREIADLNLPGTYAVQALVMKVFGQGALAWRLWDLTLLILVAAAIGYICRPQGRFAAVFAASLFALIHGRDGLIDLGQRDLLVTVLVLGSYVCLFMPSAKRIKAASWPRLASACCSDAQPRSSLSPCCCCRSFPYGWPGT